MAIAREKEFSPAKSLFLMEQGKKNLVFRRRALNDIINIGISILELSM